ncbi:MAG: hypothetical protein WCA85_02470 [Paraburkholderia sp.]|uniref:hypothetical protein n=1 Tax=Paraburkholderia sp. TaxID=1926495 RepID=UPI003C426465
MYRLTLLEQADVLARIAVTAPHDSVRSAAIEAARVDRATALQVMEIHRCLQRWAELGKGIARDEARRALAQVNDDGQGVRWYETGGKS